MAKFIIGSCPKYCIDSHSVPLGHAPELELWGGLSFAPSPAIHRTKGAANKEATKLAAKETTKAFIVFQAIAAYSVPENPVKVTEF